MPIVIGFALQSEMDQMIYPYFQLHPDEASKYALSKQRRKDKLFAMYFPPEHYNRQKASNWENTYILDEEETKERLLLKL